jgi:hypothetical protein
VHFGRGHCLACGEDLVEVVESDTDATFGDATVGECPDCGGILG